MVVMIQGGLGVDSVAIVFNKASLSVLNDIVIPFIWNPNVTNKGKNVKVELPVVLQPCRSCVSNRLSRKLSFRQPTALIILIVPLAASL